MGLLLLRETEKTIHHFSVCFDEELAPKECSIEKEKITFIETGQTLPPPGDQGYVTPTVIEADSIPVRAT